MITGQPAGFNAADIAFATDMIPHHQQAIEHVGVGARPQRPNPEVIALASRSSAAQEPEINTLKVFLVQWKENPGRRHRGTATTAGMAMNGMVDDATMAQLESLQGPEFDRLWLQSMIGHHRGAIEMAQDRNRQR